MKMNNSTRMRLALALALAAAASAAPAHAACGRDRAIWSDNPGRQRVIVYFSNYGWSTEVRFEGWDSNRLLWSLDGEVNCSNGVVFCGLSVPLTKGEPIDVPFEEIENADGDPEILVFAHLAQTTFRTQRYQDDPPSLIVSWASGVSPSDEPITLPSVYRFLGCR
jgi:hypothetical protein